MAECLNNVTLVSALYYIGRDKWKHSGFGLGNDRYKWWIPNIMSLNTRLIIFTDDHYYDYLIDIRKKYDPELKDTRIIKIPLSELEIYQKYYNKISVLMNSPQFKSEIMYQGVAEMLYPLYNVIMFNKINFIKLASELNPFNSTHFYWTDVGAFRKEIEHYENIVWPNNGQYFNDKVNFFSHPGWEYVIENQKWYFMSQSRVVQGGYFIVPNEKVNFLKEKVDETIEEILTANYIGSDEKIFDLICKRYPENFDLIKSTWFEFYNLCM